MPQKYMNSYLMLKSKAKNENASKSKNGSN